MPLPLVATFRRWADVPETMPRSLRIPEDVWTAAVEKAKGEGTTVTAVVIAALRRYLRK